MVSLTWDRQFDNPTDYSIGPRAEDKTRIAAERAESQNRNISATSRDRDTLIRTIIGEANGESTIGKAAVAHLTTLRLHSDPD